MKRKGLAILLMLVLIVSIAGCGKTEDGPSSSDGSGLKVAMVTDEGGIHDQSFNESAWDGLQQAEKDFGVEVDYAESQQTADYAPNFETLLDAGNDLIWGVGFMLADALEEAAEANPDVKYAIVDFAYDVTPDNVTAIVFKAEEPSFLVGYIAGLMTETDTVGFVGGVKSDVIDGFEFGYQAGVQYAAHELGKDIEILSQYADSFGDVATGKAIAQQMYQQGADIIFHASGDTGNGVIEAAKEQDKWAIGVDKDQNFLAPDHVLTSAMKRVDIGVHNIVEELVNDTFPGGQTVIYGLEEGAVGLSPTSDKHVPADILEKTEEIEEKIINGDIEVPVNQDQFDEWLKNL